MMHIFFALGCVFMVFAMIRLFPKMVAITLVGGTVLAIVGAAILIPFGLWWSKLGDDNVARYRQQELVKYYAREDAGEMLDPLGDGYRMHEDENSLREKGYPLPKRSERPEYKSAYTSLFEPPFEMVWKGDHYERAYTPTPTPSPNIKPVPNFEREDQSSKTLYVGK